MASRSALRARALGLADLPEPPRRVHVLRLRARHHLLLVEVVSSIGKCGLRQSRQPHERFCALLRAARDRPKDRHAEIHDEAVVAVEPRRHQPGMEAGRRYAAPFEAARQFSREQDVGELGLAVALEAAIGALGIQVRERYARTLMRRRCGGDDPGRRTRLQAVAQQRGQQEGREVVDRPGQLDAVLCHLPARIHGASVVDEHIQPWIATQHLAGQLAHRGLGGEVGDQCVYRRCLALGRRDTGRRNAQGRRVAADDGDIGPAGGQRLGRRQADAPGGTGDQNLLAVHGPVLRVARQRAESSLGAWR